MSLITDLPNSFKNEDDRKIAFEQYRIITESLNKILEVRIQANNFWTTINGAALTALAYIKDNNIPSNHKSYVLCTLIILGTGVCLSWISYLFTIAKEVKRKNIILIELEKDFPIPLFRNMSESIKSKPSHLTLTLKEMIVPILFISAYLFFSILLFFFGEEIIVSSR